MWTFFNTSLLQTYMQGALEDMRQWYSQHFVSHKHGMTFHKSVFEILFCLLPCLTVVKFVRRCFIDVSCTPIGVSDSPPIDLRK